MSHHRALHCTKHFLELVTQPQQISEQLPVPVCVLSEMRSLKRSDLRLNRIQQVTNQPLFAAQHWFSCSVDQNGTSALVRSLKALSGTHNSAEFDMAMKTWDKDPLFSPTVNNFVDTFCEHQRENRRGCPSDVCHVQTHV